MNDVVVVKLVRIGSKIAEYEISNDPTVKGLLNQAGIDYKPGSITVNNASIELEYELSDGDVVYIGDRMKGNSDFTVKIIRLGHSDAIIEVPCSSGTSIKNFLATLPSEERTKFYTADGKDIYEYRINGGASLSSDDIIPTPTDLLCPIRLIMGTRTKGNKPTVAHKSKVNVKSKSKATVAAKVKSHKTKISK